MKSYILEIYFQITWIASKDNIKTDVKEAKWEDVECILLAQDRKPVAGSCKDGSDADDSVNVEYFLAVDF
jgi:hypothetical protein